MKNLTILLILTFLPLYSQEVKIGPNSDIIINELYKTEKRIIPGESIYGIPWYLSEETFVNELGAPSGILYLSSTEIIYIFGKSHAFLFESGRLREIYIFPYLINLEINLKMREHPYFDSGSWVIEPGIVPGMSFEKIEEVLGKELGTPRYKASYVSDSGTVDLLFGYKQDGEYRFYELYGVTIRGQYVEN